MKYQANKGILSRTKSNLRRALLGIVAASVVTSVGIAADFKVSADTPVSFRANFTGVDTDPLSIDAGNDFEIVTFNFWTVLVNLRGDAVDLNGNATIFYEIQLTHSGSLVPNPLAPVVKTSLIYAGLEPGTVLTDDGVSSLPNGDGNDYLTTLIDIEFDPDAGVVNFSGAIAGDSDLNDDGELDSKDTDEIVNTLNDLKKGGLITGREKGQIIKQTNKYTK